MKLNLQSDEQSSYLLCYTQVMRKRSSFRENLPLPREMSRNQSRDLRQGSGDGALTLPLAQFCLMLLPPTTHGHPSLGREWGVTDAELLAAEPQLPGVNHHQQNVEAEQEPTHGSSGPSITAHGLISACPSAELIDSDSSAENEINSSFNSASLPCRENRSAGQLLGAGREAPRLKDMCRGGPFSATLVSSRFHPGWLGATTTRRPRKSQVRRGKEEPAADICLRSLGDPWTGGGSALARLTPPTSQYPIPVRAVGTGRSHTADTRLQLLCRAR